MRGLAPDRAAGRGRHESAAPPALQAAPPARMHAWPPAHGHSCGCTMHDAWRQSASPQTVRDSCPPAPPLLPPQPSLSALRVLSNGARQVSRSRSRSKSRTLPALRTHPARPSAPPPRGTCSTQPPWPGSCRSRWAAESARPPRQSLRGGASGGAARAAGGWAVQRRRRRPAGGILAAAAAGEAPAAPAAALGAATRLPAVPISPSSALLTLHCVLQRHRLLGHLLLHLKHLPIGAHELDLRRAGSRRLLGRSRRALISLDPRPCITRPHLVRHSEL